ncbi:MAG: hypothetical protein P8Y44_09330 [Acidobacteriota bacterium]
MTADMVMQVIANRSGAEPELSLDRLMELTPEHKLSGRNSSKADVLFYRVGDLDIALKTYADRGLLVRGLLGRWLIGREALAYRAASGIPGIPGFLGRFGPHALATEWLPATSLVERQGEKIDPMVFDRVEEIIDALHDRGVAVADLHRGDILLSNDGEVYLVDLAAAWVLGSAPGRLRKAVFDHLCRLDRIALARVRTHFLGGDVDAAVREIGGSTVAWHRWGRRLKRVWDRLRGRGAK